MGGRNRNRLYEPLYREQGRELTRLRRENTELRAHLKEAQVEIAALKEALRKLTDTKTRFRFFLFGEKQQRSPAKKNRNSTPRPPESYQRPRPTDQEITAREELVLERCPHCAGEVSRSQDVFTTWVEDIVFAPKTVTEYTIHRHWCTKCRQLVRAPLPNALPGMHVGLNTVIFVLLEHYEGKKTDEQIQQSLQRYHNLQISSGEISAIRHKAAELFGDKHAAIIKALREAIVVYGDETGWLILGKKGQCWILTAPEVPATRYIIAETRGAGVLDEALGKNFHGTMVSDFYSAYNNTGDDQQKCWVHLLRETHLLARADPDNAERMHLHQALTHSYAAIVRFKQKDWQVHSARYVETMIDKQLQHQAQTDWHDTECARIAKRLTTYHHQLLACIRHADVLPENNTAERGLRPVVVHRKITNGNRSDKGAATYQVNKTVIETLRLEGGDLVSNVRELLYQAAWKHAPTPRAATAASGA